MRTSSFRRCNIFDRNDRKVFRCIRFANYTTWKVDEWRRRMVEVDIAAMWVSFAHELSLSPHFDESLNDKMKFFVEILLTATAIRVVFFDWQNNFSYNDKSANDCNKITPRRLVLYLPNIKCQSLQAHWTLTVIIEWNPQNFFFLKSHISLR